MWREIPRVRADWKPENELLIKSGFGDVAGVSPNPVEIVFCLAGVQVGCRNAYNGDRGTTELKALWVENHFMRRKYKYLISSYNDMIKAIKAVFHNTNICLYIHVFFK